MPLRPEELIWDCQMIERDPAGLTQVLLTAVPRAGIERYLTVFQNAGLRVDRLVLGSLGWAGWSFHQRQISRDLPEGPFVLIHGDDTHREICFIEKDQLLFSRSIEGGFRDLSAERLSFFSRELVLTLDYYAKEFGGKPLCKILLLEEGPSALPLEEMLQKTGLSVQRMDPNTNVLNKVSLRGASFATKQSFQQRLIT
jgi:Tfp pilus assembly PilM family ATPase